MAQVAVLPETFDFLHFDPAEIRTIGERMADLVGFADDFAFTVSVDETTPLTPADVESVDPAVLSVESGAFEEPKQPRALSESHTADVLGRLLLELRDRLDADFGAPAVDDKLDPPRQVAWDCWSMGRLARLGQPVHRQRWLYHFRNRHGFTDAADQAFARLWGAEQLTWSELEALSVAAEAENPA